MFQNVIRWVVLGSLLQSSLALANPVTGMLQKMLQQKERQAAKNLSARDKFPHCPDFSGNWVGLCGTTETGEQDPVELSIDQTDCRSIGMGGMMLPIDGKTGIDYKFANGTTINFQVSMFWNDNRSELVQFLSLGYHNIPTELSGEGLGYGTTRYSLVSDKLIIQQSEEVFVLPRRDSESYKTPAHSCTLTRK